MGTRVKNLIFHSYHIWVHITDSLPRSKTSFFTLIISGCISLTHYQGPKPHFSLLSYLGAYHLLTTKVQNLIFHSYHIWMHITDSLPRSKTSFFTLIISGCISLTVYQGPKPHFSLLSYLGAYHGLTTKVKNLIVHSYHIWVHITDSLPRSKISFFNLIISGCISLTHYQGPKPHFSLLSYLGAYH